MGFRNRSVAIVLRNKKILMEKVNYYGRYFYTVPGGGIEEGETPEEAVLRELKEECGLEGKVVRKLAETYTNGRTEHAFFKIAAGKLQGFPRQAWQFFPVKAAVFNVQAFFYGPFHFFLDQRFPKRFGQLWRRNQPGFPLLFFPSIPHSPILHKYFRRALWKSAPPTY